MNVPARLGLYGLGLAAVFGAALGAGALTAPLLPDTVVEEDSSTGHRPPAAHPEEERG